MSLIKDGYDIIKDIATYIKENGSSELQQKVLNLQNIYIDLKQEHIDLQLKIDKLNNQIDNYKKEDEFESNITWTDYAYFTVDLPKYKNLKLCKHCYIKNNHKAPLVFVEGRRYVCPVCKTVIYDYNR
jgi:hypothetical protein